MLQRRLSICKQLIDWPPTRRFFAPKLSGRQIIKKTRPSLLTYFRRCFTLHTSQQTTALHPSEGRRTEGGKGPASRWRSATQMFWLLLAAGECITRWVPSYRTGRPSSCRWHAWINTAPARVAALYKNRLGHRRVLTAHPPGWGKGQRHWGSLAKSIPWG